MTPRRLGRWPCHWIPAERAMSTHICVFFGVFITVVSRRSPAFPLLPPAEQDLPPLIEAPLDWSLLHSPGPRRALPQRELDRRGPRGPGLAHLPGDKRRPADAASPWPLPVHNDHRQPADTPNPKGQDRQAEMPEVLRPPFVEFAGTPATFTEAGVKSSHAATIQKKCS